MQFPQFFMTIDPKYKIPRSYNWNFTYQRQLTKDTTIEAGYVGTVGNYLSRERDLNQLPTGTTFKPENAGAGSTASDIMGAYARAGVAGHHDGGESAPLSRRPRTARSSNTCSAFPGISVATPTSLPCARNS